MPTTTTEPPSPLFTAPERDLIRRSLCMQFSQYPSAAEGILLRTWRGGPCAGEPKLPPAMRTMVERGLMELRSDGRWPRANFTQAGWAALRGRAGRRGLRVATEALPGCTGSGRHGRDAQPRPGRARDRVHRRVEIAETENVA